MLYVVSDMHVCTIPLMAYECEYGYAYFVSASVPILIDMNVFVDVYGCMNGF